MRRPQMWSERCPQGHDDWAEKPRYVGGTGAHRFCVQCSREYARRVGRREVREHEFWRLCERCGRITSISKNLARKLRRTGGEPKHMCVRDHGQTTIARKEAPHLVDAMLGDVPAVICRVCRRPLWDVIEAMAEVGADRHAIGNRLLHLECAEELQADVAAANRARRIEASRQGDISHGRLLIVRAALRDRDGDLCYLCLDSEGTEIEHIVPLARGGTHTWDNIALACKPCNGMKNTKTLAELFDDGKGDKGRDDGA